MAGSARELRASFVGQRRSKACGNGSGIILRFGHETGLTPRGCDPGFGQGFKMTAGVVSDPYPTFTKFA